jgi:hypothetical protein
VMYVSKFHREVSNTTRQYAELGFVFFLNSLTLQTRDLSSLVKRNKHHDNALQPGGLDVMDDATLMQTFIALVNLDLHGTEN